MTTASSRRAATRRGIFDSFCHAELVSARGPRRADSTSSRRSDRAWLSAALAADVARRRRHADRHRPDRRHVPGVGDVCDGSSESADHVRDQAARAGRHRPGTRRARLPLRGSSSTPTSPDRVQIPVPQCFHSDITDDGGGFRATARRHGAGRPGRSDRRLQCAGGPAGGRGPGRTARPELARSELVRSGWLELSPSRCPNRATRRRRRALGDVSRMAADITIDKLGRGMSAEDRETLTAAMGIGDAVAAGRAEPVRADAR